MYSVKGEIYNIGVRYYRNSTTRIKSRGFSNTCSVTLMVYLNLEQGAESLLGILMNNVRCKHCNKVSNQDIETEVGDFSSSYFKEDTKDKYYLCDECSEWHEELMADYEAKDDPYGWEENGLNDLVEIYIEEIFSNDNAESVPPVTKLLNNNEVNDEKRTPPEDN